MNEVFAVDPGVARDARELKMLLDRFGMAQGRFVADYPDKKWRDTALSCTRAWSPLDRSRAEELLRRQRGECLRLPFIAYDDNLGWPHNAAINHSRLAPWVQGLVAEAPELPQSMTLDEAIFDDGIPSVPAHSAYKPMSIAGYLSALAPLLRQSRELTLVDPYFFVTRDDRGNWNKQGELLVAMLKEMDRYGECGSLRFVVSLKKLGEKHQRVAEQMRRSFSEVKEEARAGTVSLQIAEQEAPHDRFIFSRVGGMQVGHGFVLTSKKTLFTWVSASALKDLNEGYGPSSRLPQRGAPGSRRGR